MIKSRFKFLTPAGGVLLVILFFDLIILFFFVDNFYKTPFYENKIALYVFGFIGFFILNGYGIVQYIVTNPKWVYEKGIITIYYYDNTKYIINISKAEIEICGLHRIPLILNMTLYRDSIAFRCDNNTYYLAIDTYSNINELQRIILIKTQGQSIEDFKLNNYINEKIEIKIKYNKWGPFIFYGFYLIFVIVFLLIISSVLPIVFNIILKILALIILVGCGKLTNYICLTDKHIIIKNNLYFWKKEIFLKSDIRNVYIERAPRSPVKLILTLRNFEKKCYVVASVGTDNLTKISNDLKRNGIKLQDR